MHAVAETTKIIEAPLSGIYSLLSFHFLICRKAKMSPDSINSIPKRKLIFGIGLGKNRTPTRKIKAINNEAEMAKR